MKGKDANGKEREKGENVENGSCGGKERPRDVNFREEGENMHYGLDMAGAQVRNIRYGNERSHCLHLDTT